MKTGVINIRQAETQMRLDSNYHLSDGLTVRKLVKRSPYPLATVGEVTSNIYCPGIFRRNYLINGIPFLGGADIQKFYYNSGKYLSAEQTANYKELAIQKGWTLVTCGGTIGETVFANGLLANCWLSQHIMRVIPDKNKIREGYLYAYLASKYGKLLLTTGTYGTVIPTLNSDSISSIPIPKIPDSLQKEIDCLVQDAASLRESADDNLKQADFLLKQSAKLKNLTVDDYEYFGQHISGRKVACFSRNIKEIGTISFNAFNHSEKIKTLKASISCTTMPLCDVLEGGNTFSTGAFPRIEVKSQRGIMLVNQSDIFDTIISGKLISRRNVNTSKLVEYGEVLIAGVGTLGEGETFCRVIFANEDLEGQLVSGELIRMKTNSIIPSGYLYAWLNSDYGFRLLRSIQAGTKLCRPIPILLQMLPVPILADSDMIEVDRLVRDAHSKRHVANIKETKAIMLVENEISGW